MRQQLVCGQIVRLTAVEDGLSDVRGEIAEADEPREIGWAHPFPLGKCGKRHAIALKECSIELTRPDQQLDESWIRFCCGKRVGPLDPHPDLPPGTAQLSRHRQDLGFVVYRA